MIKNATFFESFKNAARGLAVIVKDERNIRIHISVALIVLWFARYFELTKTEWCILLITVFIVPLCEGINTAIERAVDSSVKSFDPVAGAAKDAAAAVVLIATGMSIVIGLILFLKPLIISQIFQEYISSPLKLLGLIAYGIVVFLFVRKRVKA